MAEICKREQKTPNKSLFKYVLPKQHCFYKFKVKY